MKTRWILFGSFALNAALAVAFVAARRPAPQPLAAGGSVPAPALTRGGKAASGPRGAAVSTEALVVPAGFSWSSVESPDYHDYIRNLRAIGCPEETIRDIIIADVNKLYAGRIAALYPSPQDYKYWETENRGRRDEDRDRDRQRRDLEREKRKVIEELLGINYEMEMARQDGRPGEEDYRYGFLTAEKQQQLRTLQDKYREMERSLWGEGGPGRGGPSPEARAKFAELRTQRDAEMRQLLGDQDYEQYQLRNSFTARNMRESLGSFQPSEDEFRKVFELRKAFDDQFAFTRGGDEAAQAQRQQAQQQLESQLRATLGDDRYKEYQLAQDGRYRQAYDFAQQNSLPKQTAQTLYELRQTAEAERQRLLSDQSIAADQRSAMLAAMAEETQRTLTATLGADLYQSYARADGDWLRRFAQTEQGRGGFGGGPGGGRDFGRGGRGGPGGGRGGGR